MKKLNKANEIMQCSNKYGKRKNDVHFMPSIRRYFSSSVRRPKVILFGFTLVVRLPLGHAKDELCYVGNGKFPHWLTYHKTKATKQWKVFLFFFMLRIKELNCSLICLFRKSTNLHLHCMYLGCHILTILAGLWEPQEKRKWIFQRVVTFHVTHSEKEHQNAIFK